jgi:carotenoid cleavage dioxygenase
MAGFKESASGHDVPYGLKLNRTVSFDLSGSDLPCRFEGEVGDMIVRGEIPPEIDGTFYRVMLDPFVAPDPRNIPLDGDGSISAFRFHQGQVDMKMRYVETERYRLERKARKALFGLYWNPFTYHPCVRGAIDSAANTNLVYWAGNLLALKEIALPYAVDPDTLATLKYDPFGSQVHSKTFTAHPKIDPFTNELVVYGYEATGLASLDVATYTLDSNGIKVEEEWLKAPWSAFIHDCALTVNWLVLVMWPFEASLARMRAGGHHWAWNYSRPAAFIVVPRRKSTKRPSSWAADEKCRVYQWQNCMPLHTAGAWEVEKENGDIKIYLESSRVHDNAFPFFPSDDGRTPSADVKGDFVRWELDLTSPSGSSIQDPQVILDLPCEFPRIDERFLTKQYNIVFLDVTMPKTTPGGPTVYQNLNGLAMHDHRSGKTRFFYPGDSCSVQEPVFIPRSKDAPEGDGWVLAMVEQKAANRCDIVVIDTAKFEKPVAVVQLPFHVKAQVHGNWVDSIRRKGSEVRSLVQEPGETPISGRGPLEPMI